MCLLVVLTLGFGIGASATIFNVLDNLLLSEPPFRDPDRLVRITSVRGDKDGGALSVPELDDLRSLPIVEDAAMYTDQAMYNASDFDVPEELQATIATHNLFRVLGVEPLIGSTFPESFDRTRNFGLLISYGLWVRKFGQDPDIVGRGMTLDGAPGYTIYGVMPPEFNFPSHSDLFRSSGISRDPATFERRDVRGRFVVARLEPGIGVAEAQSAVDALALRLAREFPLTNAELRFRVTSIRDMYSAGVRPYVLLLAGATAIVLIVVCANVVNLLLSRAIARDRDIAVRAALGASRWRITRQFLAEGLLLALGGVLVGAAVALAGVRTVTALMPLRLPPWMQIEVDASAWMFLAAAATLTTLITAWALGLRTPALPYAALKEGGRGPSEGVRQHRTRNALVVAEVALATVLVAGASLILQSTWRLNRVDVGFETANTLTFRVQLGWAAYETFEQRLTFHERVLARLRELPTVTAVTFDDNLPMSGVPRDPFAVRLAGQSAEEQDRNPYVNLHAVGPDYFSLMGIGIRSGRAFDTRDRPDSPRAVVVSERLAERLWPGRDPLGQQLQLQGAAETAWRTVVGVAVPVLHHDIDREPELDVYEPYTQAATDGPYYVVRTAGDPLVIAQAATAIIGQTDPNQSFLDVQAYDRRVANRIWQHRLAAASVGSFAALAAALAVIGLYGVLSYVVQRQTKDIGVRLALGATRSMIVGLVLRRGLTLAVAGTLIGMGLAFALAHVASGVLYEVSPADPLTFAGVPLLLLVAAGAACYVPALRATRVDPTLALNAD